MDKVDERIDGVFHCSHCGKTYTSKYALQHHMYIHTNLQPFRCPYCHLTFVSRHTKYNHILRVHHGAPESSTRSKARAAAAHNKIESFQTAATTSSPGKKPPFKKPLNPGQCPYCLHIYKHLAAVKVHVSKIHRDRWEEFVEYFSNPDKSDTGSRKRGRKGRVASSKTTKSRRKEKVVPSKRSSNLNRQVARITPQEFNIEDEGSDVEDISKPWSEDISRAEDLISDDIILETPDSLVLSNEVEELDSPEPEPVGVLTLCQFCEEKFYDSKYLQLHIKHEHSDHTNSSNVLALSQHEDDTSSNPIAEPYIDNVQNVVHADVKPDIRSLFKYKARVKPKTYQCFFCSKVFGNQLVLKRHLQLKQCQIKQQIVVDVEEDQDLFCCGICNDTFDGIQALVRHQNHAHLQRETVHEIEVEMPRLIRQTSQIVTSLNSDVVRYDCLFCETSLTSDSGVLSHIRTKHKDITGSVNCSYCRFETDSPEELFRHTRLHDELRPFHCDACSKRFRTREALKSHLKSHQKTDKCHHCHICSKTYFYFSSLKRHMTASH